MFFWLDLDIFELVFFNILLGVVNSLCWEFFELRVSVVDFDVLFGRVKLIDLCFVFDILLLILYKFDFEGIELDFIDFLLKWECSLYFEDVELVDDWFFKFIVCSFNFEVSEFLFFKVLLWIVCSFSFMLLLIV